MSTTSKDRKFKIISEDTKLVSKLSQHFQEMNVARIKFMSLLICALCKVQTVSFSKLATAVSSHAETDSSLRRIQRFIAIIV